MVDIKKILTMSEIELQKLIIRTAKKAGLLIINCSEYIICYSNETRLTLCSHWDTVLDIPKRITEVNDFIFSGIGLGADDKAGVYIMLSLMEQMPESFHFAFFNHEETGMIGSSMFTKLHKELPFNTGGFIGLDRHGDKQFVTYGQGNKKLEKKLGNEYKKETGSCSDCKKLSKEYSLAMVNISVGFYNEHTTEEYLDLIAMNRTLNLVRDKLADCSVTYMITEKEAFDYNKWRSSYKYNDDSNLNEYYNNFGG